MRWTTSTRMDEINLSIERMQSAQAKMVEYPDDEDWTIYWSNMVQYWYNNILRWYTRIIAML
jgi:hypothetical protein